MVGGACHDPPRRPGTPAGSTGYRDLATGSVRFDLGEGLVIPVAGLDDLIRIKRAAGRRKDLSDADALEELRALMDEQEETPPSQS